MTDPAELRRRVREYNDELNRLEIPPNGDDYNAVLDILDGKPVEDVDQGRAVTTVCANAFDHNDDYTDDPAEIVGWSVYVRDTDIYLEVETEAAAHAAAERLAVEHDTKDIRWF